MSYQPLIKEPELTQIRELLSTFESSKVDVIATIFKELRNEDSWWDAVLFLDDRPKSDNDVYLDWVNPLDYRDW